MLVLGDQLRVFVTNSPVGLSNVRVASPIHCVVVPLPFWRWRGALMLALVGSCRPSGAGPEVYNPLVPLALGF